MVTATSRSCRRSSVGIYKIKIFLSGAIPPATRNPQRGIGFHRSSTSISCRQRVRARRRHRRHDVSSRRRARRAHALHRAMHRPQSLVECGFAGSVRTHPPSTTDRTTLVRRRPRATRHACVRRVDEGARGGFFPSRGRRRRSPEIGHERPKSFRRRRRGDLGLLRSATHIWRFLTTGSIMRAVVKAAPGVGMEVVERPVPDVGSRDVLIKVHHAGVCGTDLHIWEWDAWASARLKPPVVIGHEFRRRDHRARCGGRTRGTLPRRRPGHRRGTHRLRALHPVPHRERPPLRADANHRRRPGRRLRRFHRDARRQCHEAGRHSHRYRGDHGPDRERRPHRAGGGGGPRLDRAGAGLRPDRLLRSGG